SLVVDTTGNRDITGDEVDEIDIDGVVERGVRGSYVEDMQRVVARQAHQLRCQQELIESYERLSRKILKALQGGAMESALVALTGDFPSKKSIDGMHRNVRKLMWWVEEGGNSVRARLRALEDRVGQDDALERAVVLPELGEVVERRAVEEPDAGETVEVEELVPLSETGSLHQKATTLIRGLDEVRGKLRTLVARVTPPPVGSIMQSIYNVMDWCGRYGEERDALAQFIYSTTENGNTWPITNQVGKWSWTTHEHGVSNGTGYTYITAAHIPLGDEIQRTYLYAIDADNEIVLHIGDEIGSEIPPAVTWAEVAVFRANNGTITKDPGIDLQVRVGGKDILWMAPIKDILQSIVRGEGDEGYSEALTAGSWRAFIGTYTAPPIPV
ncbi:MAG: hypothetical protein LBR78_00580, partial [Holosporales bacterium]|nr:hypothetical protein [Holosporales bacterium]